MRDKDGDELPCLCWRENPNLEYLIGYHITKVQAQEILSERDPSHFEPKSVDEIKHRWGHWINHQLDISDEKGQGIFAVTELHLSETT